MPEAAGRGLSRAELAVFAGVPFAVFFTLGGVLQTLAPLIAADALGLGPAAIGAAIGLGGLTRVAGAWAAGRLSDTVSRKAALIPGLALPRGLRAAHPRADARRVGGAVVLVTFGSSGVAVAATMIADRARRGARAPWGRIAHGRRGAVRRPGARGLLAEQVARGPPWASPWPSCWGAPRACASSPRSRPRSGRETA